ncbi:MAG: YkgJ family cysteine cluster protein [Planctomycetota bacterium]|nr:MAG: YkgJ family cysteine cluster protein [Planctomycetota bacterium]
MEKDPRIVAQSAKELEEENWSFHNFIKHSFRLNHSRVDAVAKRYGEAAEKEMDCTTCGACCRVNTIPVDEKDVKRLAKHLKLSQDQFYKQYITENEFGETAIDTAPCPFLEGNLCSVYDARPDVCRKYPYIGGNIRTRSLAILERASTCPIVFEMLEQLKKHLNFHQYR